MRENIDSNTRKRDSGVIPSELLGGRQQLSQMQGHWVLARAGKRVLRPGGIELTRQMLSNLAIGSQDRVVEFAPGLGATAGIVLENRPMAYWGVERESSAVERLRRRFTVATTHFVLGRAEESGLPDACASVVYSEALLSMQNWQQKKPYRLRGMPSFDSRRTVRNA